MTYLTEVCTLLEMSVSHWLNARQSKAETGSWKSRETHQCQQANMNYVRLCLCDDLNHFLQSVSLKRIGADGAGAISVEEGLHINHEGSFSLQGDHVEALPAEVVSRYERSRLTFAESPSSTGENEVVVQHKQDSQRETRWG